MSDFRLLITGASGFIGTNFVDYILNENNVEFINVDKKAPFKKEHYAFWKECNILNKQKLQEIFNEYLPTHVLHLAAKTDTESNKLEDYLDNTLGTDNLIEVIQNCPSVQKVIFTSTQYVYKPGERMPENDQDFNPHTAYGQSKVVNEIAVREGNLKCKWTIIRPTNIWGPWHFRYKNQFFKVLKMGLFLFPEKAKKVRKTYGYVGTVVWQIFRILKESDELTHGNVFYVGDMPMSEYEWCYEFSKQLAGRKIRVVPSIIIRFIALIGDFITFFGLPFPLVSSRYFSMMGNHLAPMEKTFKKLGVPPFSFKDNVNETVEWINNQ